MVEGGEAAAELSELLGAWGKLLAGVAALLTALGASKVWELIRRLGLHRRTKKAKSSFDDGYQLCAILHKLRMDLGGHRALVIIAHNGGEDIAVRRPLYTSILFQVHDEHLPQEDWTNMPVQESYWGILKRVADAGRVGHVVLKVDELPDHTPLKNLYEAIGVKNSIVFELHATPKMYYYVSVNRKHDELPDEAIIANTVRRKRQKIRAALDLQ